MPGKDLHRHVARIVANELLVNLENAFELAIEYLAIDVRKVEVDHRLAIDAQVMLVHDLEDRARGHVARNQIAVLRIPLFEEVPALTCRNALRITLVARLLGNPDTSTFAARRFGHQT